MKSILISRVALSIVLVIFWGGCAPAFRHVTVPSTSAVSAGSWKPACIGGKMRVETAFGERCEGFVVALGDSVVLEVWHGDSSRVRTFARADIERAEAAPRLVAGERAAQVFFFVPIVALAVLAFSLRGMEMN